MSVSKWQWRMAFALDVLVKFIVTYGGAVLGSLGIVILGGIAYVIEFAILAVAMATLNAVYLLLGQRAVGALNWPRLAQHPVQRAVLILICANAMFAGSLILLFSFQGGFVGSATFSLFYVVTNL